MIPRKCLSACLAILLAVCHAASAGAQTNVGAIGGTVVDESGAVLPGVTVTLSRPDTTVGSNQDAITDGRGAYQFTRLVPGSYRVTVALQGFRTIERSNIVVSADATTRVDVRLEVGVVEETLTVTGAAPLLDTTTAARVTTVTRAELESLPNRTDVWSMARAVPGVVVDKLDTGGAESFESSNVIVRGDSTQNKYMMDGMDVSSVSGTGTIANMYLDPFSFEETNFQIGAGSAEHSTGGLIMNMVTRTGTNTWHGGAKFNGTTPALANSKNYSAELREQLLSTVPDKVLEANPGIEPNADIRKMSDVGGWIGGPIVRDKLWFSGAWHDQRLDQYLLGSYDPDGKPVINDNVLWNVSGKVAWQVRRTAQLSYFTDLQYKLIGHRGGGRFADSRARQYNYKYPFVTQVKFTAPVGSTMALDVSYNRMATDDIFVPRPEVNLGDVATFDTTTQVSGVALPTYSDNWMRRQQVRGSLSYIRGTHDVKGGLEYVYSSRNSRVWTLSGLRANFASGVPTSALTYAAPLSLSGQQFPEDELDFLWIFRENNLSGYAQDRWRLGRKLVINAGVRLERSASFMPPACQPETPFTPGGPCFDKIVAPTFTEWLPRFNAVYDVFGDGKTALKFSANRFMHPVSISVIQRLNPVSTPSNQRQWLDQSRCDEPGVLGCDRNADLVPQLDELGPSPGFVFAGVNSRYEDGLRVPVSDEIGVELQHELPWAMIASIGYAHRTSRNDIGSRNTAVSPESWIGPYTVTEVTSGETVQVWDRPSTESAILYYNSKDFQTRYSGVDLAIRKREIDRWSLNAGASFAHVRDATTFGDRSDPHIIYSAYDRDVRQVGDRPWSYRLFGSYQLPYDVMLSGQWLYQAGAPEVTTVLVTNQTVRLSQGNQTVVVRPIGDTRYPNSAALDLNLRKVFTAGRAKWSGRVELFNITNQATVTERVTQLGPAYHRPSQIQRGRLIKLELGVEF